MAIKYGAIATIFSAMVFLSSCGNDELPPPPRAILPPPRTAITVAAVEKTEPERYVYHGDARRDPFIPLNAEGSGTSGSEEVVMPNLSSLTLKGIYDDGKTTAAIISGGGITYVLRDRRLYDNRQRMVRGIAGVIKKDSVIVIGPDRNSKELKLHER